MTTNEYGLAYQNGLQQTVRALRARGLDHLWAEEFAQTAWCRGYECLHQLENPAAVVGWVIAIAVNLIRTDKRRGKALQPYPSADGEIASSRINERKIDLDHMLEFCGPRQRTILKSRYLYGYSRDEMARSLGTSPGAIDHRVSRALSRIRRAMSCAAKERRRRDAPNGKRS